MRVLLLSLLLTISSCAQTAKVERVPSSVFGKSCLDLFNSFIGKKETKVANDIELAVVDGVEIDITPIKKYIYSSQINKKLRNGTELTAEERELYDRLVTSVSALPKRKGVSYRKVSVDTRYNSFDSFLDTYKEGSIVTEQAFTSVALSENTQVYGDILRADFIFEIEGKTLRDISDVNKLENEGIFLPGSRFKVKSIEGDAEYNQTVEIFDEEMLKDDIKTYTKHVQKYEEYFSYIGVYASELNHKFLDIEDMEYGRFNPVEMDDWEGLIKQRIIPVIRIKLEEIE